MAIQGLRDTSNFATNERPQNWREGILLRDPNGKAPLTALTSMMKTRKVDDPVFNWWEKEMSTRRVALGANITNVITDTSFTLVAGAKELKVGDLLKSEKTDEIVQVVADPTSDTTIVVQRGFAGTTKTAITYNGAGVNPYWSVIGSAYEEGSDSPTGVSRDPAYLTNYTQIFRQTLEMTRTAMKTRLRTGDQVKEAKRECLELIMSDLERGLLMGKKTLTTKNGKPLHTMDGFESFVTTNLFTADTSTGANMTWLEQTIEQLFRWGSSEKMVLCGNIFLLTIQQIIRKNSHFQITSGIKEYGMNVSRLVTPFGELVLKTHPLLNLMTGGTTGSGTYYGRNSWGYVLDMANLQYVTFADDDIKYQADLQDNGLDGQKSGYLGEVSLEVHHEKTHAIIKTLAKGIADT